MKIKINDLEYAEDYIEFSFKEMNGKEIIRFAVPKKLELKFKDIVGDIIWSYEIVDKS